VKKRIHKTNKAVYITYQNKQNTVASKKITKRKELNFFCDTKIFLINQYLKNKISYSSLLYILQRKAICN